VELYVQSQNTFSWHGAQLKRRDNFNFTFTHWEGGWVGPSVW